jgi:hypothetical protein
MTELSPAAQAILTAVTQRQYSCDPIDVPEATGRIKYEAAAALRAAADQVAPGDAMEPRNYIPMAIECQRIRSEILAIADELERQ